jgi:hypothetical protein
VFIDIVANLVDVVVGKITLWGRRKLWCFLMMTTCDSFGSAGAGRS